MTPEELRQRMQDEEERLRELRQSSSPAPEDNEVSAEPQVNRDEIRQAAQETQQVEKDQGLVTKAGEALDYALSSDPINDGLNALAAGLNQLSGGRLQGLDDAILSSEEMEERDVQIAEDLQQRREEGKMSAVEQIAHTTANGLEGIAEGSRAGLALPLTVAAKATNQDAPWSRRPETLKASPVGESLFTITEILVPSLLTGGLAAKGKLAAAATGIVAESFVETAAQDGMSEMLAGRRLAEEIGYVAEYYGMTDDGAQLARDLIQDKGGTARSINFVVGMLQNMGINLTADQVMKRILGPGYKAVQRRFSRKPAEIFVTEPGTAMFHGTSTESAKKITNEGFKASTNGVFGKGVYLTESSGYASLYAKEDGLAALSEAEFQRYLDGDESVADPGLLVAGGLPENIRLLDIPATDLSVPEFAKRLGNKKPSEAVRFLREWAKKNNFDGIRFSPDFDVPGLSALEVIVFDPKKADQIVADKSPVEFPEATLKAAKILKKSPKAVDESVENVSSPAYKASAEPTDVLKVDSDVPVSKPNKDGINTDAVVVEAIRRYNGIGADGLDDASRKYFTNWKAVVEEEQLQTVLQNATATLKRLKDFPSDIKQVQARALAWWSENKMLMDADELGGLSLEFENSMLDRLPEYEGIQDFVPFETLFREYSIVKPEGFIASALIAEELGIRMQKLAVKARLLENAEIGAIDFTNVVEQLAELHDKAAMFLIPWRRAKRKWAVEGMVQQRKVIEGLKDADVQSAIRKDNTKSYLADSEEFNKIKATEDDPGNSFRELWEAYKGGDMEAGKTLKVYIDTISAVSPESVIGAADNLSGVLKTQLKKGNLDATSNLYYQYLLTRLRPQTVSVGSNVARLVLEPLGAMMSRDKGTRAYGMGQLVGGWGALDDAKDIFWKTFKENAATNSGNKIENVSEVAKQSVLEDQMYQGVVRGLNASNAPWYEHWGAYVNHLRRSLAFHPWSNVATRGLTAGDEATKAVFATQVATGRAYQFAAETGTWDDVGRQIDVQMKNVFRGGVTKGKIIDQEVLDAAKALTFQSPIPGSGFEESNVVDKMFLAAQKATETSGVWRFFNPFPRLGYNVLEANGRMMAGMIPGGGQALAALIPRYRRILNGEMGDVAQLQFKSQLNVGKALATSAVGLSAFGYMTGNNPPEGMPKKSFIIPAANDKGYIALGYGSLEPYALPLSIMSDLTVALKEEVITNGQYEEALAQMIYSLGMASTDKTFGMGIAQLAALLNVKNFGEGTIGAIGGSVGTALMSQSPLGGGAPGGILRAGLQHLQPYQTVQSSEGSILETFWAKVSNRLFGGVGVPIKYDELTGKPIPKVATVGDGTNYWATVAGSLFNEAVFPGPVTDADKGNEIKQKLNQWNYSKDMSISNRYYQGRPLSLQEQSDLSRAMFDAGLPKELNALFKSKDFRKAERRYRELRAQAPRGDVREGTKAYEQLQAMHRAIDKVYRRVKDKAIRQMMNNGQMLRSENPGGSNLNAAALNIIETVPG